MRMMPPHRACFLRPWRQPSAWADHGKAEPERSETVIPGERRDPRREVKRTQVGTTVTVSNIWVPFPSHRLRNARPGMTDGYRKLASILPPSTVTTAAVVLEAVAR